MPMMTLIAGLCLFLGVHSVRIFADDWRERQRQKWGADTWRGAYAALSLLGMVLIIWGFGMVRETPVVLWMPPMGMRHAASLFTLNYPLMPLCDHFPTMSPSISIESRKKR